MAGHRGERVGQGKGDGRGGGCVLKSSGQGQEYLRVQGGWTEPGSFCPLPCHLSCSEDLGQRHQVSSK